MRVLRHWQAGLWVALALACSPPKEQPDHALEEAEQALARGESREAREALHELRTNPLETPEAMIRYATLLVQVGEAPQAVWVLEEASMRFPERPEPRIALGNAALLVGDPARAEAAVRSIPPGSEYHASAMVVLARAQLGLGDFERGLETLAEAERRYPGRPGMRLPRIAALLDEQRYEEARAALHTARATADGEAQTAALRRLEVTLHFVEYAQGEREAAIAGLHQMVESDPGDLRAWHALVALLWKEGRPREARDLLAAALAADRDRIGLLPLLASLEAGLGEDEAAERTLRELVEQSPSPTAYAAFARFYGARGNERSALALLREALEAFPDEAMLQASYVETLLDLGRLEEASDALRRLQAAAPRHRWVEFLRARLELSEGHAPAAVDRLQRLVPDLDHPATHFWLGRALEQTGDRTGAERRYGLAMLRDPSDPAPALSIIRLAEARGDWRAVVYHAGLVVRRSPGRFEGWGALVASLVQLGEGEEAETAARAGLEIFPDRLELHALLAAALRTQSRSDEALSHLATTEARLGAAPELAAERAFALGASGRIQEGIAVARGAIEASPDSASLHYVLAGLLFQLDREEDGARAVDQALELDPEDLRPLRMRARFRAATGRLEAARRDCEAYLERRPADARVHYILGVVLEKAGRTEDAIASYRRAAELDAQAFAPRNNLAELLGQRGEVEAALVAAQEAYALAEDDPHVMDTLGWLYLRKGLVARSISLLEEAHATSPELPAAQLHLAMAYREAGRTQDARRLLADLRSRDGAPAELRSQVDAALESL